MEKIVQELKKKYSENKKVEIFGTNEYGEAEKKIIFFFIYIIIFFK